ncbi:thioesterase family protein [Enterococcus sp. BWM-S5]|uniref:Thioesterase family protein n=1 Tax=Enterococcus larvae TaxID=2794352 RepID=A0ABS4CIP2_9ENTE|nr:thioesterase family protein [Enterococcus larvae]MBP1045669.1 thioesterase family protein [Enterococcus larvae]
MTTYSKQFTVEPENTAQMVGSGDLEVLATPALIAMVENTARDFLRQELTEGETSVGTKIDTKHLRPSKVGAEITVKITQEARIKAKADFSFEVYDGAELIAVGTHQRVVVATEIFLSKL